MRFILLALALNILLVGPLCAQEESKYNLDNRITLAKKMHEFIPVRDQVDEAIESFISGQPEEQREAMRTALRSAINYQALEQLSIDAMVETYSEAELAAMVEYYAQPEARSASDKYKIYAGKVYPEIGKMLDKALMRVKTGGGP